MSYAGPLLSSYNGGEFSPRMLARADYEKYPNACSLAENVFAIPQGGLIRRPGTRYIASVKTAANETGLIPFEFSTEQAYAIEAGNEYFRFYRNQAQISVANTVAAITNGTFDSTITGWTNSSTGAASIAWEEIGSPKEGTFDLAHLSTGSFGDGVASAKNIGLKFTPSVTGPVSRVRIDVRSVATGFNATAAIYTNNAGSPGTIVGSASDATALTAAIKSFTWSSGAPSLTSGTTYWVVLTDTGTTGSVTVSTCTDQGSTHGSGNSDTITSITDSASQEYRVEITVDDGTGSGALALVGSSGETAIATQSVTTTASVEHALSYRIIGDQGDRVLVRIGTASGASDIINDFSALPGYHTTAFTTTATTVYIQFRNARAKTTYVDDVEFLDNEPMELVTPYATSELTAIHHAQSADILYLCHADHPVMKLERRGHTTWSLVNVELGDGPWQDENVTSTYTLQPSAASGFGITITAAGGHAPFATTDVGRLVRIRNAAGEPGYAVITSVNSTIAVTADVLRAFPDTAANSTWRLGAFSETTGYPSSITFYDQRLVLASTEDQPQTFWMSQTGDIENFRPDSFVSSAVTVQDDDAADFTIASTRVNKIHWLSSSTSLVIGTAGGEWIASSSGSTITPTDISVKQHSTNGSYPTRPVRVNNIVLFIQRATRKLIDLVFNFEEDGFRGRDTTILADHVTRGGITQVRYQPEPDSIVYAKRNDGQIAALTYKPDQQVSGWTRQKLGGSFGSGHAVVESIAVIPGAAGGGRTYDSDERDEVWLIVKRTVNGSTVRYIEVFEGNFEGPIPHDYATNALWQAAMMAAQEDAFYVDCGLTYSGASTSTITGLSHLNGQTVKVLANGVVQTDKTVSGGSITLDEAATKVHVGLGYTHKYKSLKLAYGSRGGTAVGKVKRVYGACFVLLDSYVFSFGRDPDSLSEIVLPLDSNSDTPLYTGEKFEDFGGEWARDARLYIESDEPLPWAMLAVAPEQVTNERVGS